MKSRWTTYLLLAAVVAVWGIVAWKIFAPVDDVPPAPPLRKATAAAPAAADTLRLDYPDPFLKGSSQPLATVQRSVARALPPPKVAQPRRERVAIAHLGTVRSGGQPLYIVTIGGQQYELRHGEQAGDFVLAACDGDSLYLRKEGLVYGVKLCE